MLMRGTVVLVSFFQFVTDIEKYFRLLIFYPITLLIHSLAYGQG